MYGGCCYNPKGVAVTPRGVSNISWILEIVSTAEINHSFEQQCVAGTSSPIGKVVSIMTRSLTIRESKYVQKTRPNELSDHAFVYGLANFCTVSKTVNSTQRI